MRKTSKRQEDEDVVTNAGQGLSLAPVDGFPGHYGALLGYMAKRFGGLTGWMDGPSCFRSVEGQAINEDMWRKTGGQVLEQGDKYLWQAGDDVWVPVPRYEKNEVLSQQKGKTVEELKIQVAGSSTPAARKDGRVAALVKADGRHHWAVGEGKMRDWLCANVADEQGGDGFVPPSDFGTYISPLADHPPHFDETPFQRPVLFALPKAQSDELGYTVPVVVDVPYMDRSALDDETLRAKMAAIEESVRVAVAAEKKATVAAKQATVAAKQATAAAKQATDAKGSNAKRQAERKADVAKKKADAKKRKADDARKAADDAQKVGGKVVLATGETVSVEDFYNAQALRRLFERPEGGAFNTYPRYHGLPSYHILVQCSAGCDKVDAVHGLLARVFEGLEVDGQAVEVTKAHSKNRSAGDGGMTTEQRNRKALNDFKNARFGVMVVCEMFVQGTDFPELDAVMSWNDNFDNELKVVQLNGRSGRKVEGGSKEWSSFLLAIRYLEEEDDDDGDDDDDPVTPESLYARLTKDGFTMYEQLERALGKNVRFRVRYTRKKKKKKKRAVGGDADGDADVENDDEGYATTTFSEFDMEKIRELVDVDRFDGVPFTTKLEKWMAEMQSEGSTWECSKDGTRPKGVIDQKASKTDRPYQREVSRKVDNLLRKEMTKKAWDDYAEDHDLHVFAAFVWKKLGWNFKKEWLEAKERHDAGKRANPTPKETFSTKLEKWMAEVQPGGTWKKSADGKRPKGVIDKKASKTDRPCQRYMSEKVGRLLGKEMTKKAWDDYAEDHDLYVFAAFVWEKLGWDFKKEWLETKERHDAERANPMPKTFSKKLEKWMAEALPDGKWKKSPDGTRPEGVIDQKASATDRPYQRYMSWKVSSLLGKKMTKKAWDEYPAKHDLYVFAAFVWEKLGWDFKAEWLEAKAAHDAGKRASPLPKAKRSRATTASPASTAPARAPKKKRTKRPTASASTEEKEDESMMTDVDEADDDWMDE